MAQNLFVFLSFFFSKISQKMSTSETEIIPLSVLPESNTVVPDEEDLTHNLCILGRIFNTPSLQSSEKLVQFQL